ncbi:phage portal protein [Clostridium botulinum]|nr:phage portal protein [Clostridium botulinum]NFH74428.1 phage portal protein [Clostridium botulinum]NFJ73833.1 phage portal protein [Clostridium botulinum]NFN61283.1 phage portal protein [Clostridium botulinum]
MGFIEKNIELLNNIKSDFETKKILYDKMYDYCVTGKSEAYREYKHNPKRSNLKVRTNFIKKFIKEEVAYLVSNKITYTSKTDNKEELDFLENKTAHWDKNHEKMLLRDMLSFGSVYELYYTTKRNDEIMFNSKIISPRDGYVFADDFGNITMFLRFFKKKFDTKQYIDIYTPEYIYHVDEGFEKAEEPTINIFREVPVRAGTISQYKEHDTLFNELKDLQDAFETNLSDIVNEISDYRLAYLIFSGCQIDTTTKDEYGKTQLDYLKEKGAISVSEKDGKIYFLTKEINDTFVQNTLNTLKKNMYEISNHIDTNEKLQSNLSGSAIRNRLIGLEQRVKDSEGSMKNIIQGRLYFLFKLFNKAENLDYDYRDISAKFTLNIPQDDVSIAQIISQIPDGILSKQTSRTLFSFMYNSDREQKLIDAEKQKELKNEVDLDKVVGRNE